MFLIEHFFEMFPNMFLGETIVGKLVQNVRNHFFAKKGCFANIFKIVFKHTACAEAAPSQRRGFAKVAPLAAPRLCRGCTKAAPRLRRGCAKAAPRRRPGPAGADWGLAGAPPAGPHRQDPDRQTGPLRAPTLPRRGPRKVQV